MLAGKTTLAMSLLDKLNLNYLSIDDIKTKRRNGVKVTLKDDSEIVNAVVKKLQYLKKEYRVVLEGFPENVN